jgi:hypothetical protein
MTFDWKNEISALLPAVVSLLMQLEKSLGIYCFKKGCSAQMKPGSLRVFKCSGMNQALVEKRGHPSASFGSPGCLEWLLGPPGHWVIRTFPLP